MSEPENASAQPSDHAPEITFRGLCLGAAITVVFTSANLYLGLKTGMTFSSSIPAAIISMSVLKLLGSSNILENNIVQTQASAAGTLCNVILVVPGLLLIHYWSDFPLVQTIALCLLGGLFGVVYSVPLRRIMVLDSDLPFPEGVAAAEVLRSGHQENGSDNSGLYSLAISGVVAGVFNLVTTGFKLLPDQLAGTFAAGYAMFRFGGGLSLALIGVGYLVRIGACLALLIGVVLAWFVAVPILTSLSPHPDAALAETVWSEKVRLIGAGIIAVGGLWTVATLVKPIVGMIRSARQSSNNARGTAVGDTRKRDTPLSVVALAFVALCLPTAVLFLVFAYGHPSGPGTWFVILIVLLTAVFGFTMAAACGYMAGLLGSSSSPISGIGILSTMLVAVCFAITHTSADPDTVRFIVAFTLFITSFIVTISSIANDNLQDLKTGQIVGATPWKQQVVLAVGVVVGALTVAPVLKLLYEAYGFPGSLPHPGLDPHNVMPAPQAALMTEIASGIIHHQLAWTMVYIGAGLGVVFIVAEAWLRRRGLSLPALTVGIGMYLPLTVVVTIALGGVIGWLAEKSIARRGGSDARSKENENLHRRGILISSGFLVGESLTGVVIALSDTIARRSGSLSLHTDASAPIVRVIGTVVFCALLSGFYRAISHETVRGS